jgi:pyruvate/2-oxoglutarate dehydrogenase complex dihydrolipoamide acyltransferase (E2) component/uncharacterized OsmC-like protein
MTANILMPQLGQAMVSGVIMNWHVGDGEKVEKGALLLTIESDKSAFEIEAPASGVVKHHVKEGVEVDVGTLLGTVGETAADAPDKNDTAEAKPRKPAAAPKPSSQEEAKAKKILASPKARAAAARANLELAQIVPARKDGMITEKDVEEALKAREASKSVDDTDNQLGKLAKQKIGVAQKTAIQRLQKSWSQAPHMVQMIEVDARRLVTAQRLIKKGALKATLNDIIMKAAADSLADFPELNAYIENDEIIYSDTIDVSIAVATDRGLRTPVVRNLDKLSLEDVARATKKAIDAALEGKSATGRASLTVSNLGKYGVLFGTPVLNLNEPVLIFVGAITEKPRFEAGAIVSKPELFLSIAYDHRIVDGLKAAMFSDAVRKRLEQFELPVAEEEPQAHSSAGRHVTLTSDGLKCDLKSDLGHSWVIDEPPSLGGSNKGPDPVTSTLGSLLSCLVIAFRLMAKRRSVNISRIEGFVSSPQTGKVENIDIHLRVYSPESGEKIQSILKMAKSACYVHSMLSSDIKIEIKLDAISTDT